jgi:Zn-dependent protease
LAASAKTLESRGQLREAREEWLRGLSLLPGNSKQAAWVLQHTANLQSLAETVQPKTQSTENKWAEKLGPAGPVAVLLAKSKALLSAIFKLKFLLSFAAFFGFYWAAFGLKFGLGFALLILIHEMGHFIDVKRRGLPADMPIFLPGLGAYVRWQGLGVTVEAKAAISLAGPLAGLLGSLACAIIWWQTGDALWAGLARAGAWLNALNLIPIWVLDGGQAVLPLNKSERFWLLTICCACWLFFGESVFFLVAVGFGYQLFFVSAPSTSSRPILVYFGFLLGGFAMLLRVLPGQGFGTN